MRVLLVHPPLIPAGPLLPPLGLCTLASWLLTFGHEVRILDLDFEIRRNYRVSPGSEMPLLLSAIEEFAPDVVGITSMYSNSLQAERLVREAKRYKTDLITVAGGPHFGAMGIASLIRIPELDFCVQGEGEVSFLALLDALHQNQPWDKVPSLCYRAANKICTNSERQQMDLAKLPLMWMNLGDTINLGRYFRTIPKGAERRIAYVEAGRGCPFTCTFCGTAPFWHRQYRVKEVGRLVEEIQFLHEEYGYDSFVLIHDLLMLNPRFVSDFCDAMLEARLPVEWMANSRTDIRLQGLLSKMKAAGCWKLFFGVESGSTRIQDAIDKHLDLEQVVATVTDMADHGITSTCSFILGMPDEKPEELSATIALGARLKLIGAETVQFHRLRLWPPAQLSQSDLPVEFDLDSLRIEFPFSEVPANDIQVISEGKNFFGGYFVPQSLAGSSYELAQVEMFFHHAIALAPLTVATLAQFLGCSLVSGFYIALKSHGAIPRDKLDWESGRLDYNWRTIYPFLDAFIFSHGLFDGPSLEILAGVLDYENRRLCFAKSVPSTLPFLAGCDNWTAFRSRIDIPSAISRLQAQVQLTPDLLIETIVVLSRHTDSGFESYTFENSRLSELLQPDSDVVRILGM